MVKNKINNLYKKNTKSIKKVHNQYIQKKYNAKIKFSADKNIKRKSPILIKRDNFKLKKKWRFWRGFKQFFINKKKITFYKKLQWNYNEKRLIWHQLIKSYLPNIKNILLRTKKINVYTFFLRQLELRLPVILVRSKFYTKLINSYNSIKLSLILVNGVIINKITHILSILDLYQKKRHKISIKTKSNKNRRFVRLKWRKFRWKKARYIFWKIRRLSHFNLYLNKKINSSFNYLEINYKVPAGIVIKQPFINEFMMNREPKIITHKILKKIFFLY